MPLTTPRSAAQATAPAYQVPSATSEKAPPATAGLPSSRHRTVTTIALEVVSWGEKAPSAVPTIIPLS